MRLSAIYRRWSFIPAVLVLVLIAEAQTQNQSQSRALKTPLKQETLTLLANELSGQAAFNNVVKLAGAPWIRDRQEFSGTLYEAQQIYDLAQSYGAQTARIERYPGMAAFDYAFDAELWVLEPERRRVATLASIKALGLTGQQANTVLNYVNGKRSVLEIRNSVVAELDEEGSLDAVVKYLDLLGTVKWVSFESPK